MNSNCIQCFIFTWKKTRHKIQLFLEVSCFVLLSYFFLANLCHFLIYFNRCVKFATCLHISTVPWKIKTKISFFLVKTEILCVYVRNANGISENGKQIFVALFGCIFCHRYTLNACMYVCVFVLHSVQCVLLSESKICLWNAQSEWMKRGWWKCKEKMKKKYNSSLSERST